MKLVTAAQMRALEEQAAAEGRPPEALMEDAGLGVAQEVWVNLGAAPGCRVAVLVGPGNNGGDGLVAARHLQDWGAQVEVVLLADRDEGDPNLKQLVEREIVVRQAADDLTQLEEALSGAEAVVDAVLGTGRARPLGGTIAQVLELVSEARAKPAGPKVFAVDIPTGVDCDTGAVDPRALRADVTIALGCSKFGLHTLPGAEFAGQIELIDLGLPAEAVEALPVELLNARWVRDRLPKRPAGANKGTFGRLLIVAGSRQYVGAARLAALGALRSGAGLVTVACPSSVLPMIASGLTEATFLPLSDNGGAVSASAATEAASALPRYDALLLGPGLGQGASQQAFVRQLLMSLEEGGPPVLIDADGLNNLANLPHWWERVAARCVLTPHPGEQSRLTRRSIADIQANRLTSALEASAEFKQTVALKGAYSIIAGPDGRAGVNPYANAALASAGTGDVLAGAIAGLMAQGLAPFEAACCGAYVHAAAAQGLKPEQGDAGMLASDLLPELPRTLRELRAV
ncbi:MAG: NAD(P)H-hydrate dehydratase [Chloroflexi bacterium]|nr:NAD(P)H-hydrate dehydratase [Chloroflexota bacterium]